MDYKYLMNFVVIRKITSIEELSERTGPRRMSVDDIKKAFANHPKEYERIQKDMEHFRKLKQNTN